MAILEVKTGTLCMHTEGNKDEDASDHNIDSEEFSNRLINNINLSLI